ncbi:putative membrane protein [Rhodopirellula sallentina SM41]|uniref:Putative membrane protein n=1 Tax=Rhodopirellula sallentina SM41 TaxID=1263870 RepID=M5UFW7_9BACT|nr:putative membrane protein [Rhodopirellula sallentina SM41]
MSIWYVGDVLYNDFAGYRTLIGDVAIENAWWQVCGFVIAFITFAPVMTGQFAGPRRPSQAVAILERRPLDHPAVQAKIDTFAKSLFVAWVLLMIVALVRVKFNFLGLFAPYLTYKAEPWSRNRMGGGIDSLLALAGYFQVFLTAGFGVILALARNRTTRRMALIVCCLSMPYYIFDRTRNTMLATMIPGFSAWVFGRVRGNLPTKFVYIGLGLLVTSLWFSFVLSNRTNRSISAAFASGASIRESAGSKHLGLNMCEELSWINRFFANGSYEANWGKRYFAEAANPIPRIIWPGKPTIGIDYAIARGQGGGSAASAGVYATISTGMIGQGVVNFGPWLGPIAAALLMAIWVGILARQDRVSNEYPARLMLYALGLILTFNMGRDITLLVLYPFIFGWILIAFWERRQERNHSNRTSSPPPWVDS